MIETFVKPSDWELSNLRRLVPSCFNGIVSVRRYRITIEEIAEPDETIVSRITDLWNKTNNHHDWRPLQEAASKFGVTLTHNTRAK